MTNTNTYYINYHTGAGDKIITGTLEDAMNAADKGAAYTQQSITIHDTDRDGAEIACRQWWGYAYDDDEDEEDPICFGSFGFYGDWVVW